jgi:exodeoxyribonuclease VII large subunit|tara:strand:+ start:1880 stop:3094 length:1215 start_codon:yes stop_codon:yes gene_type:complete
MNIAGHSILTITQVANQVKYTLEKNYANLWIQGEIASCKPYPSGHIYLTLKDGQSELSAVIFAQYAKQLQYKPVSGLKVTVNGDLSLYSPRGQFQLQIRNLYPTGQGELWLAYEALKEKLELEGLFSPECKKLIPQYPSKIGIITSSEGAVLRDIIQVLNRRAPHVSCLIFPVPVQGKNAAVKISEAIESMNQYGKMDTLIVGRGGGSLEDLWCFNDEQVVRAIFASQIPVITAIGHETDTTLADYAADYRAPTPSAAAEIAAEDRQETIQYLDSISEKLYSASKQFIYVKKEKIDGFQKRHGFYKPHLVLEQWDVKLIELNRRIKQCIQNTVNSHKKMLDSLQDKIILLNPKTQLKRGFAIATDSKNNIIFSPDQVKVNDDITVRVARGILKTKVKEGKIHNA